jgi:hypothetical protein
MMIKKEIEMNTIYMVSSNTYDPSGDTILGFYPTMALAKARKSAVESDPYYTGDLADTDFAAFITPVNVTEVGADTFIKLR